MKNVTVTAFCIISSGGRPNSASNSLRLIQTLPNSCLLNSSEAGVTWEQAGVKRHRRSCENFSYSLFFPRDLCDSLIDAPLFSISWCRTVGPHQSPIRFKALGAVLSTGSDLPPLAIFDCPRKLSVPRRVQGYRITDPLALPVRGPTLLWLTAWAYHRITAPPSCRYVKGRDSGLIGPCGSKPTPAKAHYPIPTVKVLCQANAW